MKDFNLSEWALEHRAFTGFMMVLLLLGGIFAYFTLEQREDPKFTFRLMVVKTIYPGATALEVENQVTDRLEKNYRKCQTWTIYAAIRNPANPSFSLRHGKTYPLLTVPIFGIRSAKRLTT